MSEIVELQARAKELEKEISRYNNLQLAKKVQLNSAYGAIGNEFFRFFDVRLAEAITISGQLSINWIEERLNEYLNTKYKTTGVDYIVAVDTDSVYLRLGSVIEKTSIEEMIDALDKLASEDIEPFIKSSYEELSIIMNAYQQKMNMSREVIANKGIWTAKKHYILNVYDNEGVRYTEPHLKIMGIETQKSSTPAVAKGALKDCLKLVMNGSEADVQSYVRKFRKFFNEQPFEEIALPRGISDIDKYQQPHSDNIVIVPKTPIHVRGSIIYNHLIKKLGLEVDYEIIKNGEKVKYCYLKEPNFIKNNVIACMGELPPEFKLDKCIDYELQFLKAFLEPLQNILSVIGWQAVRTAKLF